MQLIAEGKFLRLLKTGHWEYAERVTVTNAVVILAVTDESRLLFTEQYRPPLDCAAIELPAGLVGDIVGQEGEAMATAVRRELLEETGYDADSWQFLATCPTSAGLTSETVSFFRARNLRKLGPGGGDEHEKIIVHEVPLASIDEWLAAQAATGKAIAALAYAGLYLLSRDRAG